MKPENKICKHCKFARTGIVLQPSGCIFCENFHNEETHKAVKSLLDSCPKFKAGKFKQEYIKFKSW